MKKKGFTLIELLAIIVILAIIALIAVPVVLNIIDKAKVSSYERSSENVLESARLYYNESILDKTTDSLENVNVYNEVIKTLSGDTPEDGEIYITKDGQIAAALKYGNYCFKKDKSEDEFKRTDLTGEDECVIPSQISYKCIRSDLDTIHTEECAGPGNPCYGAGYYPEYKGTTITYGNEEITEGELNSGDAFDCDVDGTGYNHRFYYVTDLESNPEYAVLIYSNNTIGGVADNSQSNYVLYDSTGENWNGPVDAITDLPTTKQWSNISLSSTSRAITTEEGTTTTTGLMPPEWETRVEETLPTAFSYTKTVNGETVPLAARLLTYQEVVAEGCREEDGDMAKKCTYLIDNTYFSSYDSNLTAGYLLETPSSYAIESFGVFADSAFVASIPVLESYVGVRPVIEVLKSEISY